MDPTANLAEQRRIARRVQEQEDRDEAPSAEDVRRLAELVIALDDWIARGGFLPEQWR